MHNSGPTLHIWSVRIAVNFTGNILIKITHTPNQKKTTIQTYQGGLPLYRKVNIS
ncbi:hypothetical protein QFZ81_000097 [Paenibacillus sp. V4I9]|nr:hypothetical protein [Paenibacillus sp. V4I9]